ncbi:MAG: hypothetical protein HY403_07840, partial [Elusimicrobia bacterium]|nr:hypothetical protein [Elusimicrobiota bacterium]
APAAAPKPAPAAKTVPCPRCAHANLEEARFCNACSARMDGRAEEPPPPAAAPPPDPFKHLDPMISYPAEPAPMSRPEPTPRPPGRMGRLGALEETAPAASYFPPSPSLTPDPAPAAAPPVGRKRPVVPVVLAGLALAAAGLAYVKLRGSGSAEAVIGSALPARTPPPETITTPPPLVSAPPPSAPPAPASPTAAIPAPKARKAKKRPKKSETPLLEPSATALKPKRARPKVTGKRAAKVQARQEKASADEKNPVLDALLSDATQSSADAAADSAAKAVESIPPANVQPPGAKPRPLLLPGFGSERPVSASGRAAAPQVREPRPPEEGMPAPAPGQDPLEPAGTGRSTPTPGIEDEALQSAESGKIALGQVHEQFDFCAQLLAQGAYGDHYDTCLCKDAREAAPYNGRRGVYAAAMKKAADDGRLQTAAKIVSSKIEDGVAKVVARGNGGRDSPQTWKLEDGLWCRAP